MTLITKGLFCRWIRSFLLLLFTLLSACVDDKGPPPSSVIIGAGWSKFQKNVNWESYEGIMVGAYACVLQIDAPTHQALVEAMGVNVTFNTVEDTSTDVRLIGSFFQHSPEWQKIKASDVDHGWKREGVIKRNGSNWRRTTYLISVHMGTGFEDYLIQIEEPVKK